MTPDILQKQRDLVSAFNRPYGLHATHSKNLKDFIPAVKLYRMADAPEYAIRQVIDVETNQLILPDPLSVNGRRNLTWQEHSGRLEWQLRFHYLLTDPSLHLAVPDGIFNRHDRDHIKSVEKTGIQLLDEAVRQGETISLTTYEDFIRSVWGHDAENKDSRPFHSYLAYPLLEPWLTTGDPQRDLMNNLSIILHDEHVIDELMKYYRDQGLKADNIVGRLRQDLPLQARVIVPADKIQIGLDRVSLKAAQMHDSVNEVIENPHTEVNFFWQNLGLTFSEDGKTIVWNLNFTPDGGELAEEKFPSYLHNGRLFANERRYILHKEGHPFLETSKTDLMKLYYKRIEYIAMFLFSALPKAELFTINMLDAGRFRRRYQEEFRTGMLEDDFIDFETIYSVPKDQRLRR